MQKEAYHKKPTYDEVVKESITNPTDKIGLPDRMATQLRNTPQLTRYDDESLLDLKLRQPTHKNGTTETNNSETSSFKPYNTHTHTVERAMNEDASMPQAPPPPPPPPAAASKIYQSAGSQTAPKFQTTSGAQT